MLREISVIGMNIQQDFEQLIQKRLTRKEFLRHFGVFIISVVGLGGLLQYLGKSNFKPVTTHGYGSGPYGGSNRTVNSTNHQNTLP